MLIKLENVDLELIKSHKSELEQLEGTSIAITDAIKMFDAVLMQPKGLTVSVTRALIYAKERYKPIDSDKTGMKIIEITGKDTLSKQDMKMWSDLGINFELIHETIDLSPEALQREQEAADRRSEKLKNNRIGAKKTYEETIDRSS